MFFKDNNYWHESKTPLRGRRQLNYCYLANEIIEMKLCHIISLISLLLAAVSCSGEMNDVEVLLLIIGICCLIGLILFFYLIFGGKEKFKKNIDDAIAARDNFTESKAIRNGNSYFVATDEAQKKVFYVDGDGKTLLFDYKDVVSVDVNVDGETTVLKKSLAESTVGAFAGDLLIGGKYGSFIGALAAGNSTDRRINKIIVHVLLRNQSVQSLVLECYCGGELGHHGESYITYLTRYNEQSKIAQDVYDMFSLIIDTVAQEEKKSESPVQALKELAELHEKGVVTDEEFEELKKKIIKAK